MLAQTSRTVVHGPVRTVVWQGLVGDRRPYADQRPLCDTATMGGPHDSAPANPLIRTIFPTRRSFADGTSELTWTRLNISRLKEILKSPIYAGAYAYGRRSEKKILVDGEIQTARQSQAQQEWIALIESAHEGYITWETYLSNLEKLTDNAARRPSRGAPREGQALLSGIALCGRCGRRMRTIYPGKTGNLWTYKCSGEHDNGGRVCWMVAASPSMRRWKILC